MWNHIKVDTFNILNLILYKKIKNANGGFASGVITLGGLQLSQITKFQPIWTTNEGGGDNIGATFYEPWPLPDGFSMLGSYAQPNNKPLFGWVLVGKDIENGTLKPPVDYSLVWSSESSSIKKNADGYFWLPIPPTGYQTVGLVVTNSSVKPSLDKIRCVRADLVEASVQDEWIWGGFGQTNVINVYGLAPTSKGSNGDGVQVGTFDVLVEGGTTHSLSLSCLKNEKRSLSSMPNLTQIQDLVQKYSPFIYLHPDEPYLPSSVSWFFNNGALLYQKGNESNPIPIDSDGSELPKGGADDETYWLDLPRDEGAQNNVKKGDLQSAVAYLHVKPMLGGMFTDICVWIFYPFNGAAKAKVMKLNIGLGKLGEHVGDWEHLTLRISNFDGSLWKVYFAEHNKGIWVDASQVEYQNGNRVVAYASLHGHALYPHPGLVLQGNPGGNKIGLRNDAAKSNIVMDVGMKNAIVSAEYLGGSVAEPPWLNYMRKWGPKVNYDIAKELKVIQKILPKKLDISKLFPSEVLGEDGPAGPKGKNNWSGDEII
ncbi:hypothetical protein ACHQM5_019342 [Ranunculus cassubicifolius]